MTEPTACAAFFMAGVLAMIAEHGGGAPFWALCTAVLAATTVLTLDD